MPVYESGGLFYYRMVDRVLFGLGVSNMILFFWLLARALVGYALVAAPLPFIVAAFRQFAKEAYEYPSKTVPLDESRARDASVAQRCAPHFDPALYTQPSLRDQGGLDPDRELDALLREDEPPSPLPASSKERKRCCGRRSRADTEYRGGVEISTHVCEISISARRGPLPF